MTAAIYYHPEAYTTSGPKLMGRNAAGESFLRGFFAYSRAAEFWAQVQNAEHAQHFARTAQGYGRDEPVKAVDKNALAALAQAGVVYFPGPGLGAHAFQRAAYGHGTWSLCGITHTTSSATAMDALAELIAAPVQPWDAVICTSTAVKANVERLLQAQVDYLKERLGIQKLVLPQLPVIPLGIHTQDFAFTETQKAAARSALGVDGETLVVLFAGRLSFHAKAHPLAMYQALENAARATGKRVLLLEFGVHSNEFIARAYAEAAQLACPSVEVRHLPGREAGHWERAWAGADIFCSLSDNVQEAFGITSLEAMAAGLPLVVSDWDGYKDTVRDGIDGFRIPTLLPPAGFATDLALRHALEIDSYDMYIGHAAMLTAVDVESATQAFARLFSSPELRRQMGDAGRQRARALYDWAAIIPQYETLWAQLDELRRTQSKDLKPLPQPWPARMDPFHAFAAYPTFTLSAETTLGLVDDDLQTAVQRAQAYRKLAMVDFARFVLPADGELEALLSAAASGPSPAASLVAALPKERQPFAFRSLAWLVKMGVLRRS